MHLIIVVNWNGAHQSFPSKINNLYSIATSVSSAVSLQKNACLFSQKSLVLGTYTFIELKDVLSGAVYTLDSEMCDHLNHSQTNSHLAVDRHVEWGWPKRGQNTSDSHISIRTENVWQNEMSSSLKNKSN